MLKLPKPYYPDWPRKIIFPKKPGTNTARPWSGSSNAALGLEVNEPASKGLTIRVLGLGCTNCQTVFNRVMEVLNELNLTADLEHVTDVKKIASYGIMGSPALLINGKVVSVGQVPSKKQIENWLKEVIVKREGNGYENAAKNY